MNGKVVIFVSALLVSSFWVAFVSLVATGLFVLTGSKIAVVAILVAILTFYIITYYEGKKG
jgi:hypothetical protein